VTWSHPSAELTAAGLLAGRYSIIQPVKMHLMLLPEQVSENLKVLVLDGCTMVFQFLLLLGSLSGLQIDSGLLSSAQYFCTQSANTVRL
jgi:hypothetical protein